METLFNLAWGAMFFPACAVAYLLIQQLVIEPRKELDQPQSILHN